MSSAIQAYESPLLSVFKVGTEGYAISLPEGHVPEQAP